MNIAPTRCPYKACSEHVSASPKFFRKRGYFKPQCRSGPQSRYQCKACLRTFSNRTAADDARQRKPQINQLLPLLIGSGVTLRRAAKILKCAYNTIASRQPMLALRARLLHEKALLDPANATSRIEFDEIETFEHSRHKNLTIALAVRGKNGFILSAKAGRIPSCAANPKAGQAGYRWTANQSPQACLAALAEAGRAARPGVVVAFDGKTTYPGHAKAAIPGCAPQGAKSSSGSGNWDPIWKVNHACARMRADLACMARRTWSTTKKMARLQDRLDIWISVANGYAM